MAITAIQYWEWEYRVNANVSRGSAAASEKRWQRARYCGGESSSLAYRTVDWRKLYCPLIIKLTCSRSSTRYCGGGSSSLAYRTVHRRKLYSPLIIKLTCSQSSTRRHRRCVRAGTAGTSPRKACIPEQGNRIPYINNYTHTHTYYYIYLCAGLARLRRERVSRK